MVDDLDAAYRGYAADGASERRWSPGNAGNRYIREERNRALSAVLAELSVGRLLEVGCGGGALLADVAQMPGLQRAQLVGVDLLAFRLELSTGQGEPVLQADGQSLPFPDASFDVVVLATVLSSIRDDELARRVSVEVDRVLGPGGAVVLYDMRRRNPANPNVRPISARRLAGLFPDYDLRLRSTTVLPPLARRLHALSGLYPLLTRAGFLHTHLVGALIKPHPMSAPPTQGSGR